jgi:hypothetical protein
MMVSHLRHNFLRIELLFRKFKNETKSNNFMIKPHPSNIEVAK